MRKESFINGIFSDVAKDYDLVNDLTSFGLHRKWKDFLIDKVNINSQEAPVKILDLACGSGDIALRLYHKFQKDIKITMADPNLEMLDVAKNKFLDQGIVIPNQHIETVHASAESLPFEDNYFDYVIISYGLRNFSDPIKGLEEVFRVLKKGGTFLCLEFSTNFSPLIDTIYSIYSNFIPFIGLLGSGNFKAYKYLADSIKDFPGPLFLSKCLQHVGFLETNHQSLCFGVTTLFLAKK